MPIYEYQCKKCRHSFEALLSSSEAPAPKCPKCGATKPERQLSVFSPAMGRSGNSFSCNTCPVPSGGGSCASGACPLG